MKASELRIGNLVYNEITRKTMPVYPMMIPQLAKLEAESNIKPIPLTEEWLLKLGFEKHEHNNGNWFSINCAKGRSGGFTWNLELTNKGSEDDPIWFTHYVNLILHKSPKYVHQLQNLYHALTGKELEYGSD